MASRISPWTWPVLALSSPVLVPKLLKRNRVFKANRNRAEKLNRQRITGSRDTGASRPGFPRLDGARGRKSRRGLS